MAHGDVEFLPSEPDADAMRRWDLARRQDLAYAFGLIFSVPWHGQDADGEWYYGLRPFGGWLNATVREEFQAATAQAIQESAQTLADTGVPATGEAALDGQFYTVGPAAQSWPMVLYNLYQDARPFLADGATLLAWAAFLRLAARRMQDWFATQPQKVEPGDVPPDVTPILTQPAVASLIYADLAQAEAPEQPVALDIHCRAFTEYATADHPGGDETYLARATVDDRRFIYVVDAHGTVSEHYVEDAASEVQLLPVGSLLSSGDDSPYDPRFPLPPLQIQIKKRR